MRSCHIGGGWAQDEMGIEDPKLSNEFMKQNDWMGY